MCMNGLAITSLLDANSNFFSPGLPVFYRIRNFDEASVGEAVSEMGFQVTPPLTGTLVPGTTDSQICPQPAVELMSLRAIADATKAGSTLRLGARRFNISHSWVQRIQVAAGYSNPRSVFNDKAVVGIYHDGLLFEIVSITHNDVYGGIISWDLLCNANDIK